MTPNIARIISCKAWNSPAEYPNWVARCDIEGSDGTMLNLIFWKKVQGHKHPGRWGIVEHQIPSIKVLFKTNAKSHKHPGIELLSSESKTQFVNQRKQNSYRRAYIYIYCVVKLFYHNPLTPIRCGSNLKSVFPAYMLQLQLMNASYEIALS